MDQHDEGAFTPLEGDVSRGGRVGLRSHTHLLIMVGSEGTCEDSAMTDSAGRRMLLDTAALYFRAFYGVPDTVNAPNGMPINAVRGLLDIIARLVTEFEPTEIVACWDDDWRPQWRVDLIPTYKTHRVAEVVMVGPDVEVIPDPLEAQVPVIREALTALGIPIVGAANHEADDVIGTLASTNGSRSMS